MVEYSYIVRFVKHILPLSHILNEWEGGKLRVCLVSGENYQQLLSYKSADIDLTLLGFTSLNLDYIAEITNEEQNATQLAYLSRLLGGVVVAGVSTELLGERRKSAVLLHRGRLLSISDMINTSGTPYSSGDSLNVIKTAFGKLGVVIDGDIYSRPSRALKQVGCAFIVCLIDDTYSAGLEVVLKMEAKNCPIYCVTRDISVVIDTLGNIVFEGAGVEFYG